MNRNKLDCMLIVMLLVSFFIGGCKDKTTDPNIPTERWKRVTAFGETTMTGLYLNSDKTRLFVTSTDEFGLILPGDVEPNVITGLETQIDAATDINTPFIDDDFYIYCDKLGLYLFVGDNNTGEYIGVIPITTIVDSIYFPARFSPSYNAIWSTHIESNNQGLYMISIRQTDHVNNNPQDDRLYFGSFHQSGNSISFVTDEVIKSYEEPASVAVFVYSNYYYAGYFWQYTRGGLTPPMTVVDEKTYFSQQLTFYPKIRYVIAYNDYTIGFFDRPLKKSYDNGFTWEDWLELNAPWNYVRIADKHVFFFSHNLASIDFETIEIENYDVGELLGNPIIGMAEFDNKVFAATDGGLFYCDVEDFFVPKYKGTRNRKNDLDLEILKKY